AFAMETPPAREVLAESRTMKASGAAGVATLGAAGVEVAQNVLAETQTAILPLVPYLDTLRWVFIAAALAGLAVTIYARIDDWKRGGDDRRSVHRDRRRPVDAGGAALRSHRTRGAPVPAHAPALRRAC